jgi:hypothetical protein
MSSTPSTKPHTNIPEKIDSRHADSVLFEFRELYRGPVNSETETRHVDPEDLVLYALQFLNGEQAFAISKHIEQCKECHREFGLIQGDLAAYALTVDLQSPPHSSTQRLLTQVAKEKKVVPIAPVVQPIRAAQPGVLTMPAASASTSGVASLPGVAAEAAVAAQPTLAAYGRSASILSASDSVFEDDDRPTRSAAMSRLGFAGWVLAVGASFWAYKTYKVDNDLHARIASQSAAIARLSASSSSAHQLIDTLNDDKTAHITLTNDASGKAQPSGHVIYNADSASLIFLADDLAPLEDNKIYELWMIPADGHAPIAAALFHPDAHGSATVLLPSLPKGVAAKAFGVTVEDAGGAQSPTLPIVLAGN